MGTDDFAVKQRIAVIRARTWTLTGSILVTLILYFLVQVVTKEISWVDFVLIGAMQVALNSTYFPDGELYGQKGTVYINNKSAYNAKATLINEQKLSERLREFCEYDYKKREKIYIENACGQIGISPEELDSLRELSEKQIKQIVQIAHKTENGEEVTIHLSKHRRKLLFDILFKPLPVERNYPETILSAVDNDGTRAVRDLSIKYKNTSYIGKFVKAFVVGGFLALIGYQSRHGITLADVTRIMTYLTSLISTAVTSYSKGETCSKVYKNQFYVDLSNYIDRFFEWADINQTKKA